MRYSPLCLTFAVSAVALAQVPSIDQLLNAKTPQWSLDSKRLAFLSARDGKPQIYVIAPLGGEARQLTSGEYTIRSFRWSPDGEIAFVTSSGKKYSYHQNLAIATVTATGSAITLRSETFDKNPQRLEWGADGIWFGASQKTERGLFLLNPATNETARIALPDCLSLASATLSERQRSMAFLGSGANRFAEVYVSDLKEKNPRRLSDVNSEWKSFRLASREVISWKSKDGNTIEARSLQIETIRWNNLRRRAL